MKKIAGSLATLMLLITVLAACGQERLPPGPPPTPTAKPGPVSSPEQDWTNVVEAARKERSLNIYATAVPPEARTAIQQAFKQKYGLDIEYTNLSAGEIVPKYRSEMSAGLYIPDLFYTGASQFVNLVKPMNITIPVEPLLALPEVLDGSKYYGGKLPFFDADKHGIYGGLLAGNYYMVNTEMVKPNELTASTDLANPKWKGQLTLQDPTRAGASQSWVANILLLILGREQGERFLRDLAKQQPVISADPRQLAEWVARGKYKIGIGISMAQALYFMEQGAPVAFGEDYGKFKEPRALTTGATMVYTFKNVPHPNARKVFINWFLTREGSALYAPIQGYPSTRVDVPTGAFNPVVLPRPGDKLAGEESELKKAEFSRLSAEIFKDLLK